MRKRISLREKQLSRRGVGCPECGGKLSRVDNTWDTTNDRRRRRICSHAGCGHTWITAELTMADVGRVTRHTSTEENDHGTEEDGQDE